jgi:hypothetical protein
MAAVSRVVCLFFPNEFFTFDVYLGNLHEVCMFYLFLFGINRQFDFTRVSCIERLIYIIGIPIWLRFWIIAQASATLWGLLTTKKGFDIVEKSFDFKRN